MDNSLTIWNIVLFSLSSNSLIYVDIKIKRLLLVTLVRRMSVNRNSGCMQFERRARGMMRDLLHNFMLD